MALSPANAAGRLPPHVWDAEPDPALPALEFSTAEHCFPAGKRRLVLSNSFAFGGNNAALILGAA
jgi:3-oxoacyl-[acyl-carrier-protein] synthase-1